MKTLNTRRRMASRIPPLGELNFQLRGQRRLQRTTKEDTEELLLESYTSQGDASTIETSVPRTSLSVPFIDERSIANDTVPLKSIELQRLLNTLRLKEERVVELETVLALESGDKRQQLAEDYNFLSLSHWPKELSEEFIPLVKRVKSKKVSSLLLTALQSETSTVRNHGLERQAAVVEQMQHCATAENNFPNMECQRGLYVVERGELAIEKSHPTRNKVHLSKGAIFVAERSSDEKILSQTSSCLWWVSFGTLDQLQQQYAKKNAARNFKLLTDALSQTSLKLSKDEVIEILLTMDERVYDESDELQFVSTTGELLVHLVLEGEAIAMSADKEGQMKSFWKNDFLPPFQFLHGQTIEGQGRAWLSSLQKLVSHQITHCLVFPMKSLDNHTPHLATKTTSRSPEIPTAKPHADFMPPASQPRHRQLLNQHNLVINDLHLSDLKVDGTMGVGSYGRVELVHVEKAASCTFARKRMTKAHLAYTQQMHIAQNEKKALEMAAYGQCGFIVQLYCTFKDSSFLYLLMEPLLGGDLQTLQQRHYRRQLPEHHVQFYAGCVLEALDFLHKECIVYRGLKPEDVLLDNRGYAKLCDFGSCKLLSAPSEVTHSFCGTPEYLAPEVIENHSHGLDVDLWALGVFIFELTHGQPPFRGETNKAIYNAIMSGINAIKFPWQLSKQACSLVRELCQSEPSRRLGSGVLGMTPIRQHTWFQGIAWKALQQQTLASPYVPHLQSEKDLRYFESYPPEQELANITEQEKDYWKDF